VRNIALRGRTSSERKQRRENFFRHRKNQAIQGHGANKKEKNFFSSKEGEELKRVMGVTKKLLRAEKVYRDYV